MFNKIKIKENVFPFIAKNWFKIILIICVMMITFSFLTKKEYYFIQKDDYILSCDKASGECFWQVPRSKLRR